MYQRYPPMLCTTVEWTKSSIPHRVKKYKPLFMFAKHNKNRRSFTVPVSIKILYNVRKSFWLYNLTQYNSCNFLNCDRTNIKLSNTSFQHTWEIIYWTTAYWATCWETNKHQVIKRYSRSIGSWICLTHKTYTCHTVQNTYSASMTVSDSQSVFRFNLRCLLYSALFRFLSRMRCTSMSV
jgi:hypothetical protein